MSDTPQNDDVIIEEDNAVNEINDSVSDSETENPVQDESNEQAEQVKVDEVEVAKQKANEVFNKQYGQLKQAERERDALKAKQEQFEQAERERQAALVGNIPPMPDAFDDDYDEKVKKRDEAIIAQANFNAQNQAYLNQQQFKQQQEAQAKQVQIQESAVTYSKKATELGIKQEELQSAANRVAEYGLSDDLALHILNNPNGPLITKYLAEHPQDGFELAGMSPFGVDNFLNDISAKASALKPKTSNAPNPAKNLQGKGVDKDAGKYKHLGAATFD
jgi:uncharacterized membrane protein